LGNSLIFKCKDTQNVSNGEQNQGKNVSYGEQDQGKNVSNGEQFVIYRLLTATKNYFNYTQNLMINEETPHPQRRLFCCYSIGTYRKATVG